MKQKCSTGPVLITSRVEWTAFKPGAEQLSGFLLQTVEMWEFVGFKSCP